ncbi:MAG: TetR/AcrR family transcriptional regulator [Gammaproteobacteria bacterium]|nr:TetR/AcrR family transcriptional regulator [Gammaproteobacteria bacterium]MBT5154580.1 TetR/AcrR family transcriptional regulator [Gammaproteobacteria bacterium]MBT5724820.1 TetR/AcrR family transcriptional regulator [Gammaproteobacteria bacterium]MBT6890371.1 TetR/AcrR family transcriptional regulator [Gammaproteobacteria bacterium]
MTENRLARRASIMETARQMIAEKGYESITIRELASACRVSVPTLYNQFGGKDQLLAAAIEDHFVGDPDQVKIKTSLIGLDRIFAILDFITFQFLQAPDFHRRLLEAFGSLDSMQQVQRSITASLAHEIGQELGVMQDRRELESWVDPELLAGQVTTAFISSTIIWGSGIIREDQLTAAVQYGTGLVLVGVLVGDNLPPVRQRIEAAQELLRDSQKPSPKEQQDLDGPQAERVQAS